MSDIHATLDSLGITLPKVVPPVASYQPAVRSGNHVYVSGQLPMVEGELPKKGKVGADLDTDAAYDLARTCALNGLAAVASIADLNDVTKIVKVTGFVASAPGYNDQPKVINGASEVMGEIFQEAGKHARAAVGVSELPLDAPVEVELIVELKAEAKNHLV